MIEVEDYSNKRVVFVNNLTRPTDNKSTIEIIYSMYYNKTIILSTIAGIYAYSSITPPKKNEKTEKEICISKNDSKSTK